MNVVLIPVGETPVGVAIADAPADTLSELQLLVGGYVEVVAALSVEDVAVQILGDEDGRIRELPVNRIRQDGTPLVGPLVAVRVIPRAGGTYDWAGFEGDLRPVIAAVDRALARPS